MYGGEWRNGQKHGKGTLIMKFKSGESYTYSGDWRNNTMHGKGDLEYSDGSKYTGLFAHS